MKRSLAVTGLFLVVLFWNLFPPWLHQRPGRPVCIEFHAFNWIPVTTDEIARPYVLFELLLIGDVILCVALGAVFICLGRQTSTLLSLRRGQP